MMILELYMGESMKKGKRLLFLSLLCLLCGMLSVSASADWSQNKKGTKIWYTDDAGVRLKGLQMIGQSAYWFDEAGLLQTGWVNTGEGLRYFEEEGKAGSTLGSMARGGIRTIGKYRYGFGENGVVLTGLCKVGRYWYYFRTSGKASVRGRALTDRFVNLSDGRRAYFRENGRMAFGRWVRDRQYYVDETGSVLRNAVAPGGWLVGQKGKKVRQLHNEFFTIDGKTYFYKKKVLKNKVFKYNGKYYYADEEGVRRTGWVTYKNHTYYFKKKGYAATGRTKIAGVYYEFDSKGRLDEDASDGAQAGTKSKTGKTSILILCGHGQGDIGAVGKNKGGTWYEYLQTREFGKLVYETLRQDESVSVDLFHTGYDMFQQIRSALNSAGITSSVTGSGKNKKKTLKALRKNKKIPELTDYDFVLEIHFNATLESSKDPSGNGNIKGTGTYFNANKSSGQRNIDKKIIRYLNSCGLRTYVNALNPSTGLLNARAFQEIGVNYTLLETCFIDDNDDMKFYKKNKEQMAKQVSQAIIDYFK